MKRLLLTGLGLLLCVTACSSTPTPPVDPPKLQALLAAEAVEGKYKSRDELMADPTATPIDTDNQLIQTEAALRRANRDQIDAADLLQKAGTAHCGGVQKLFRRCVP